MKKNNKQNRPMNKILSLIFSILVFCTTAEAQTITITEETAISLAQNLTGDTHNKYFDYYISKTKAPFPVNGGLFIQMQDSWFVLVDMYPNEGWEHPCKYVTIKGTYNPSDKEWFKIEEATVPPSNISLKPVKVANRYGTKAKIKPIVPKIKSNDPNLAAEHTYAVILNGGLNRTANDERYWNDCAYFYKTLRNRYSIPKQNINVIMADGTSSDADMKSADGTGYISSPLDLDGDGAADIEYSATKGNLQAVFNSLAQKLTDEDHLIIFVTGHGKYDINKSKSCIYLWNNVLLYSNELNTWLNNINAGFISVVMEPCYSGGFINELKKTNRIIATACKDTERSFSCEDVPHNDFVYNWTSAINGYDATGNKINVPENISIIEAWRYAARNDGHANGVSQYGKETPMINYFTHSVEYDLSLANIPPVVNLCFENYENLVSEQNTKEYDRQAGLPSTMKSSDLGLKNLIEFWRSPYIWLRNQEDGLQNHKHERLNITDNMSSIMAYMYTQIRNNGVKPYTNKDSMSVRTYWVTPSIAMTENDWRGVISSDNNSGGLFGSIGIENNIEPGKSTVILLQAFFWGDKFTALKKANGEMCMLAFLKKSDNVNTQLPVDSNHIVTVWATDKLAQTNICQTENRPKDTIWVSLTNFKECANDFEIRVKTDYKGKALLTDADVSLSMSPDLITSWNNGGQISEAMEKDKNFPGLFHLKNTSCKLSRLKMSPQQKGKIGLRCNFFADEGIAERKEYDIDITLIDHATGQCLGGETFRVMQEPRDAINPLVETAVKNGKVTLTATNVTENAVYYWYASNGKLVGTGKTFNVPAGQQASNYTVRVEATSDGAISYSSATMAMQSSSIKSVDCKSNPNEVRVTLEGPAASNATLRLASSTGNAPVSDYSVESGATTCTIPSTGMPSGIYQVTLIENGTVTGTKKFTK
ncbi:MAG: hypothetical protein J6K19_04030 [Prevotella sp.]|nr:hypothetical protein [Prevotella sp.]